MANNMIQAVLDYRFVNTEKVWQYDYGQILRLQEKNLPKAVELQNNGRMKHLILVTI